MLPDKILDQIDRMDLDEEWFQSSSMPAMVHDILLENREIEEPWLPGRAEKYQWISEMDWVYFIPFTAEETGHGSFIRCMGLDGIVDIYLNGKLIASHSNMYLPLLVDISKEISDHNRLVLHFHSVFNQSGEQRTPIRFVNGDQTKPVRRPGQNYGNYLGPYPNFSRVGVYDHILLEQPGGSKFDEIYIRSSLNEQLDEGKVTISFSGTSTVQDIGIRINVSGPDGELIHSTTEKVKLDKGSFNGHLDIGIDNPGLWWPRGYGDPLLYTVQVDLVEGERDHQRVIKKIGFRRVTMQDTLHFMVNNIQVKLWGGDWVTPHWKTAVWDQERVGKLFELAENANFNAFRIWGEVESPRDAFYETADEKGFMLWQDFTLLPLNSNPQSIEICKAEAGFLIKRLVNHPSVFIWCGGNENALWHHPEYNGQLEDRGDWPGTLATDEIRRIIQKLDPERFFIPSSPYYGIDPNDPARGNTHGYTNMWFVPGYDYLNFASEDTRIAAPVLHSLKSFMSLEDIWPENYSPAYKHGNVLPFPESWMEYTTSFSWKKTGPVEQFYDPTDAASLVHRLGMAESLYYQDVIERQRRGRPATDTTGKRRCGGYLVWKFNDSWPQVYSGKVDYFLEPYHAYYTLKKAYQPVMLSFEIGPHIYLWAVNDSRDTIEGELTFQLLHLDRNEVRAELKKRVSVPPGQSKVILDLYREGIGSFRLEHVLFAVLKDQEGETMAVAHSLADIERRITFPDAKIEVSVDQGELRLSTDKYARTVILSGDADGDEFGWFFEDNYFDLMPGEEKRVRILGKHKTGTIKVKAWYSPYISTLEWEKERKF
jgi:beta-galactosidase/beta-glucuronidase